MNFYNPYYFPYQTVSRTGLFNGLLKKLNFTSIINGTQRTLNTINQIIPLVKQARPMIDNAKTMFKLMSEFNRSDEKPAKNKVQSQKGIEKSALDAADLNNYGPTFFQ